MQGGKAPGEPRGAKDGRQDHQGGAGRFSWRLTVNEWLTFLVGAGSLAVSYMAWQTAADTSDLKEAVAGLTKLVGESHNQTAALQTQAHAARDQLKHMVTAQRAWLLVDGLEVAEMRNFPAGAGMVAFASYKVANIGRSPASAISINTKLVLEGIDEFNDGTVRELCRPQATGYDRMAAGYKDTLLPGQSETIRSFPTLAGMFARRLDGLDAERDPQDTQRNSRRQSKLNVSPVLAGCVTYRIVGDDALRRTGFAVSVRPDLFRTLSVDIDRKGQITAGPLTVGSAVYGNFAD